MSQSSPEGITLGKGSQLISAELKIDNKTVFTTEKQSWNREEVKQLLIDCCGEVSCEDGTLLGKEPDDLIKWIENKI